ncbi:hypothetical protein BDA96_03G004100 [Sorghum bicolor]|jgi:hypothetical protein|uniref:Uncharacterized protein n=2 Tax=Sorghum bicolor TaxID=4558 RepID=A0A921R8A3_SORBI|nr:uncharacterized protein LOC8078084 [Sorghum bicolor]KAG0535724.1 hypothetical protein BDA96_03G004100 [Sorghum bicolor]KXG31459.1 hypothetical protein SORBI_3003G004100 [Sorghum bicolor]|eukprot:XP_002457053.2 uncharacterized protein LOC8078084 [Sorghum bicolor]
MLPASHPLLYACVFRDTHLVAELPHSHSQTTAADPVAAPDAPAPVPDDDLPALAAALVAAAPPHHRHLTHTAAGRAHALLLSPPLALAAISRAPHLPASQLLLFLRRLRCLPEARMRDEMPRLALRLPLTPGDDAREADEVAAAEEEAARRDADLAARTTPKRDRASHRGRAGPGWTWRRQLWMVIIADLLLLTILFAAWLAVCRGFSCIGR